MDYAPRGGGRGAGGRAEQGGAWGLRTSGHMKMQRLVLVEW